MDITSSPKWKELIRKIGVIEDKEAYQEALALFYEEFGYKNMTETGMIPDIISTFELDTKLNITYRKVREDLLILERKKEIGIITDKESYKKALEKCYEKYDSKIFDEEWIKEFIDIYELDTRFHINNDDVQNDLRKIIYERKIGIITDKESYKKALEKCYEKYGPEVFNEEWIQKYFIDVYELDTLLHINIDDIQNDLKKIKYIGEIGIITDKESYKKALEKYYEKYTSEIFDKERIQEFIDIYELDTLLHINIDDIQNDLKKIKYIGEIGIITDTNSYEKTLNLYYEELGYEIFDKEKIDEFIDIYQLDTVLHIGFSDVCIDLVRLLFENEENDIGKAIKVIIDDHSYLEALELLYLNFDEIIIFDEEIICKFINAYHLDTRFNITPNDVWTDLAKIKRQSELEDKLIDEIGTVEDIESYKEALELYYNVFGANMFEIDKVQKFIDTFELYNIYITPNTVYRDLRSIKSAFGSRDEISQSNFTSLYPDIKPAETIAPPVQTQRNQTQNINAMQPEEDDHDYLEKREVDKDFGKKVDGHKDFYFYVINMSDTELINTINNQYKNIKGSWTLVPRMGEYGSVEFAVVLLLWKYAVNNFSKNPESYASLQIMLGDIICCAFFGMPAGEWSDKVDPILNAHTDIVSYEEFGNVYNYLRNNHIDKIHSLEFNNGNMQEEVYKQFYEKFIEIYNSTDEFSEMLDFYTSKGLKIKDDIHFKVVN